MSTTQGPRHGGWTHREAPSPSPQFHGPSYDAASPGRGRQLVSEDTASKTSGAWATFARCLTCCAPSYILGCCDKRFNDNQVVQAWREKVALCFIIFLVSGFLIFLTAGLRPLLCPDTLPLDGFDYSVVKNNISMIAIQGQLYYLKNDYLIKKYADTNNYVNFDQTSVYARNYDSCRTLSSPSLSMFAAKCVPCYVTGADLTRANVQDMGNVLYSFDSSNYPELFTYPLVIDGNVLDMTSYFQSNPPNDDVHQALQAALANRTSLELRDATKEFMLTSSLKEAIPCLKAVFTVGYIGGRPPSCVIYDAINYIFMTIVLAILTIKFTMALLFAWIIAPRLVKTPSDKKVALWPPGRFPPPSCYHPHGRKQGPFGEHYEVTAAGAAALARARGSVPEVSEETAIFAPRKPDRLEPWPYVVMLVTAYSEDTSALRLTLDSMAATIYPDDRKCFFIVVDGEGITGKGNEKATSELVLDLLELDSIWGETQLPYTYKAVALGGLQLNAAKVYVGYYVHKGGKVPCICVVKCGSPAEKDNPRRGNRGKRDSQIILMRFFSNVFLNERMCPLEYDIFRKLHYITGVTPDFFEAVLMVDADTKVLPDSISLLVNTIMNDRNIMGLCGETRIENKRANWVTGIQVYEYFIAHHLGKCFEAIFGGVTCLPGCFCMYRLKAPGKTEGSWVPILATPDVVEEYSQNMVYTLHEKNLLLLGEDRFLSTLMLKTFPKRKMMFVPAARCRTTVPESLKALLSQRRRWINSTIHNLMELALVNSLCGPFCCSMQGVVILDIFGTATLPIGTALFYYFLFIALPMAKYNTTSDYVPLILVLLLLFLPAFLVLLSTRKVVYVMWMGLYLLALPVWNILLPLYAYWHFDDFAWGETRKTEGSQGSHDKEEGAFDPSKITMKRWAEYETAFYRSLRKKLAKQRQERSDNKPQEQGAHGYGEQGDISRGYEYLPHRYPTGQAYQAEYYGYEKDGGYGQRQGGLAPDDYMQEEFRIPSPQYPRKRYPENPPSNPEFYNQYEDVTHTQNYMGVDQRLEDLSLKYKRSKHQYIQPPPIHSPEEDSIEPYDVLIPDSVKKEEEKRGNNHPVPKGQRLQREKDRGQSTKSPKLHVDVTAESGNVGEEGARSSGFASATSPTKRTGPYSARRERH